MTINFLAGWTRKEWTANPADPTAVTRWRYRGRWLSIMLLSSWGVESELTIFGRTFRHYDAGWAKCLFGKLEDRRYQQEMAREADPMGPLSRYE